jgi:hypothetical protein
MAFFAQSGTAKPMIEPRQPFPTRTAPVINTRSPTARRATRIAGASLHRNLEGRLYRGSAGEKGFQLSLITPFEIGV